MKRYGKAAKAKIVEAAKAARSEGKTWKQAFDAAKKAGYRGSLAGIGNLLRYEGAIKARRGRKQARRGPGRPPKAAAGTASIAGMVEKLVETRVRETLGRAIAALETIKG